MLNSRFLCVNETLPIDPCCGAALILRGFGLKVGPVTRKEFEVRIGELVRGQATLERVAGAMLSARATLKAEYEKLRSAITPISVR